MNAKKESMKMKAGCVVEVSAKSVRLKKKGIVISWDGKKRQCNVWFKTGSPHIYNIDQLSVYDDHLFLRGESVRMVKETQGWKQVSSGLDKSYRIEAGRRGIILGTPHNSYWGSNSKLGYGVPTGCVFCVFARGRTRWIHNSDLCNVEFLDDVKQIRGFSPISKTHHGCIVEIMKSRTRCRQHAEVMNWNTGKRKWCVRFADKKHGFYKLCYLKVLETAKPKTDAELEEELQTATKKREALLARFTGGH